LLCACGNSTPGTSAADGKDENKKGILVTADIYSGRENPSWRLSGTEGASVLNCLSKASVRESPSPSSDSGLGFRAFVVSNLPTSIDYREMKVSPSMVEATKREGSTVLFGDCSELYALLRKSAEGHVGPVEASTIPKG
jgi:hypothetical protein